jgi:hypothetical protein
MKKEEILDFINRYHLGGKIESAAWTFENGAVTTKFRSGDKSFMGMVTKDKFGYDEDCQIGILTTGQLIKLLGILESEFEFGFNKHKADDEEKIVSMKLVNGRTRINYMLADLTVIPKAKGLKADPDYNLTVNIDNDFIELFIKGKGALPDTKSFTLVKNSKTDKYEVVIGYSSTNANSVYIPVDVENVDRELDRPISFSAEYFKEILSANKGADEFKFTVSEQGISHTVVKAGDYSIDYYLAEVQTDV